MSCRSCGRYGALDLETRRRLERQLRASEALVDQRRRADALRRQGLRPVMLGAPDRVVSDVPMAPPRRLRLPSEAMLAKLPEAQDVSDTEIAAFSWGDEADLSAQIRKVDRQVHQLFQEDNRLFVPAISARRESDFNENLQAYTRAMFRWGRDGALGGGADRLAHEALKALRGLWVGSMPAWYTTTTARLGPLHFRKGKASASTEHDLGETTFFRRTS